MPRRSAEQAAHTRELILDAALGVFADAGFVGARLDQIAAHAGVTRGAVYHHFNDKTELYLSVLKERWQSSLAQAVAGLKTGGDPNEAAGRAFVVAMIDALNDDPTTRALLRLSLSRDNWLPKIAVHASDKPEVWALWQAQLAGHLGTKMTRAQASNRARIVILTLVGYGIERSLTGPEPRTQRRALARALLQVAGVERPRSDDT